MEDRIDVSSLRIFTVGQLVAASLGALFLLIANIVAPATALRWLLIVSIGDAVLNGLVLYLIRVKQVRLATYLFIASGVIAIALAAPAVGIRTGMPSLFVWPIATASMLLGLSAGIVAALFCAAAILVGLYLELNGSYTPLLSGTLTDYIGTFTLVLSLFLVVIVATVAGGNIRRALASANRNAAELAQSNDALRATFVLEAGVKAKAGLLADELTQSSSAQRASANKASEAISEVTAQSAELSAAATQIATAARHIRDVGEQTRNMAAEARNQLDSNREQLNQAVRAGEQLQEAARSVSDRVKQMSQILSLITEVAEETHMLSLNATIEATGTGEAGRRFRVIAAEVGSLASKVNSSTEQVASIVKNVQSTAQQMLTSANQTVATIHRSQMASSATTEQISQVADAADAVAHEGFLIVSSTEQQRRSTDGIAEAMQDVTNVAHQTAATSDQSANIAAQLQATVQELGALAPTVTIDDSHDSMSSSSAGAGSSSQPKTNLVANVT